MENKNIGMKFLYVFVKNYDILVRPVYEGDIIEIDTYEELKEVDSIYDC